jgi:acyl-CoA reductase-like NAD-dependent aldehyde dehydrogenase
VDRYVIDDAYDAARQRGRAPDWPTSENRTERIAALLDADPGLPDWADLTVAERADLLLAWLDAYRRAWTEAALA